MKVSTILQAIALFQLTTATSLWSLISDKANLPKQVDDLKNCAGSVAAAAASKLSPKKLFPTDAAAAAATTTITAATTITTNGTIKEIPTIYRTTTIEVFTSEEVAENKQASATLPSDNSGNNNVDDKTPKETSTPPANNITPEPTKGTYTGEGTFYSTGLGACGGRNKDSDYIVALSENFYKEYTPGNNPNKNTLCGKKLRAFYNGKSVDVTVVDCCVGCGYYDLDFSPAAFRQLADQKLGRIQVTWLWLEAA